MEDILGISIEIDNYRIHRMDVSNIVIQKKRIRQDGNIAWDTEGYYTTEEQAFLRLFDKIQKDKYKKSLTDVIDSIGEAKSAIINAIKGNTILS